MRIRILLVTDPNPEPASHFDSDPDPTFYSDADQNLEKVLTLAYIPYILACHMQIDADQDPAYHFDADPNCATILRTYMSKKIKNIS
jgi:hypothetical protein